MEIASDVLGPQLVYRTMLDAVARPGTVKSFAAAARELGSEAGCSPAAAAIALTLLDREVTHAVFLNDGGKLAAFIRRMTFSPEADAASADYVFAEGHADAGAGRSIAGKLKTGTLEAPEESAMVLLRVDRFAPARDGSGEGEDTLVLSGPGIPGEWRCAISGVHPEWWTQRERLNAEFPMGTDWFFFTDEGLMMAIPRTTRVRREAASWHTRR